jgi:hypothetical protein
MTTTREVKALRRRLNQMKTSRDWHKKRAAALVEKSHKRKTDRRIGFQEGAAAATLTAYLAIQDYGLPGIQWLSDRMSAVGKNPPRSNEIDELVTRDVIRSMAKYSPQRATEIEMEFQKFLAGDSK